MPVDFFATTCNNGQRICQNLRLHCLQIIPDNTFCISDTEGGNGKPATIKVTNLDPSTDFTVYNNSNIQVRFKAIDWCIEIYRTGTYYLADENRDISQFSSDSISLPYRELIKRCEGFIHFNNTIVFLEIKNRSNPKGGWIKDAREKFEESILSFKENHPELANQIAKPILSNPSFRGAHANEMVQKKILKDKIGVEFIRQDTLVLL